MPGKVNPTQCEAMVMICIQVIGEDTAVAFAGSQGNFELNAMRPIIINNFLHSAPHPGATAARSSARFSVEGTRAEPRRRSPTTSRNRLMLVTALSPVIGYDKASQIAHEAMERDLTLKEAAIGSGEVSEAQFEALVDARTMVGRGVAGA